MSWVRRSIFSLGLVGCLLFSVLFIASFAKPALVEQSAKELIRIQIQKKTQAKIDAIDESYLIKRAALMSKAYADQIAQTKRLLTEQLPARIATVMAEMGDLDCECRKKVEVFFKEGFEAHIKTTAAAEARLTAMIRAKYMDTAAQLTREFRIFTGTNAGVFAALLLALWIKPKANIHLVPAALVLVVASGITATLYLFGQNWAHTLLFSDYIGFAYLAYLAGTSIFLGDIVFNRGQATSHVMTVVLDGLGSAIPVLPC